MDGGREMYVDRVMICRCRGWGRMADQVGWQERVFMGCAGLW